LKNVDHANWQQDSSLYRIYRKRLGRDSIQYDFKILKKEGISNINPEITTAIFINNMKISRVAGNSNNTMTGGGSLPNLNAKVQYIVWDYSKDDVVSCGEIERDAAIFFAATANTWRTLFKSIGRKIIRQTPFGGR
jgi:hypothetical protein